MNFSIEIQVISKILTAQSNGDTQTVDTLCSFDSSYYGPYKKFIEFILDHKDKNQKAPDIFTFQTEFLDDEFTLVDVSESVEYLSTQLRKNKQYIIFLETMNKMQELGSGDITEAWEYINLRADEAFKLTETKPMDIIHQGEERAQTVIDFSRQKRIPTGFPEIDKALYGGWSTIEELAVIEARTNVGKSWFCVKVMEAAQKSGFKVAYYSPEMRSEYLAIRFDSWRAHFKNSELYLGKYSDEYTTYIKQLATEETPAYIIEDKDINDGVSVKHLEPFIKRENINLLIIDGLSYMVDDQRHNSDYDKYQHITEALFQLSKKYNCAVIIAVQANRETKEEKDDKGVPFPTLFNIEGSDHIARKATQVFSLRQIFETHVLDVKLIKSRTSSHVNEVWSYAWDINTGNIQYLPGDNDTSSPTQSAPSVSAPIISAPVISIDQGIADDALSGLDEGIEF